MKKTNFTSLRDYAIAKSAAVCNPEKPYFDSLCHYTEESVKDKIVGEFLDSENSRISAAFDSFIIRKAIKENGKQMEEDGCYSMETSGLKLNDEDVLSITCRTYSKCPRYQTAENTEYISEDEAAEIIPFLQKQGFLPTNVEDVDVPGSELFSEKYPERF